MRDDPRVIVNRWTPSADGAFERARVLAAGVHPEGLDAVRVRFSRAATVPFEGAAHLVSLMRGAARMRGCGLDPSTHASVVGDVELEAEAGTELIVVTGRAPEGRAALVVRQERFLAAALDAEGPLRWILTPQYLSRRIFLHHDAALLSQSGAPVSWFRTTMFDTTGLPPNDDGESVFRMSYNHRTEPNFCYDVQGHARVRFAEHPYDDAAQRFGPWHDLDGETTYHLNEARGGAEEEHRDGHPLRNRHEVANAGGHTTLFCLFDPAPTGVEEHHPGTYSEYGALDDVLGSERYAKKLVRLREVDAHIDTLSLAAARGEPLEGTAAWAWYEEASEQARNNRAALLARLDEGRRKIVAPWAE